MKTRTIRKNKINVVTLGCSKNIVDSEMLMGQLKANHIPVEHESEVNDFNVVIINTCGFIETAKQESIDTIIRFAGERKSGKIDKLFVTGCLSGRYKNELEQQIPEVDAFFGTGDLPRLLKTLKADYKKELLGERLLTTPNHYAFLKISEGCDRLCSFCAIPLIRGKHISVPSEHLLKQAKLLAEKGVKELILIAQDLTYYGLDLYGKRTLASLLKQLSDIDGIEWIRLHYAFPAGFPTDILTVMNERQNICKYLDIPFQHISNRILESMHRGTNREKTNSLIKKIREKVPGIALRTTLIAGYPGETEKEFEELKEWVNETEFERLGIFTYSHEENTPAFRLKDNVTEKIKRSRADDVMKIQQGISLKMNKRKIGKTLKVLIDRKEGSFFSGRTEHDSPDVDNEVLIPAAEGNLQAGQFATVKIISAGEFDLFGELKKTVKMKTD